MLAACGKFMDQWPDFEGSLITGFVVIVEAVTPAQGDDAVVTYACGNGGGGGLGKQRVLGMVKYVEHEMLAATLIHRTTPDDAD